MQLSDFIQARLDAGETRSDMGRKIGVHPSYITRWLSGTVPETKLCRQIADAYGLPTRTVLEMAGHYAAEEGADPEWDVMQRQLRAIFESYDRSKWADLTNYFRAGLSLSVPALHGSSGSTPDGSRRRVSDGRSRAASAAKLLHLPRLSPA